MRLRLVCFPWKVTSSYSRELFDRQLRWLLLPISDISRTVACSLLVRFNYTKCSRCGTKMKMTWSCVFAAKWCLRRIDAFHSTRRFLDSYRSWILPTTLPVHRGQRLHWSTTVSNIITFVADSVYFHFIPSVGLDDTHWVSNHSGKKI